VRTWKLFDHLDLFEDHYHLRARRNPQLPSYIADIEIYALLPFKTAISLRSHHCLVHNQTARLKGTFRSRRDRDTRDRESSKSYDRSHGVTSLRFVYRFKTRSHHDHPITLCVISPGLPSG
jgi:hypothetical protein